VSVDDEVLGIAAAWDTVLVENDAPGVASFMTDDWVYIDRTGAVSKTELIGWIASGRLAHHSMHIIGQPRVTVHGDTGIVSARKASSGSWEGVAYTADEWISEVFVREDGRWLCALSHKCPVEGVT
jgi:ketosteroid isomerase-like protein